MKMTREEMQYREAGYFWAMKTLEMPSREFMVDKIFLHNGNGQSEEEIQKLVNYWLRGAYDALIGLGIVSPLGKSGAAKQTGYTRNAIQKAIENGYLKATLVDGHYNIHPLDLEAWRNSDKKRKPYKKIEKP